MKRDTIGTTPRDVHRINRRAFVAGSAAAFAATQLSRSFGDETQNPVSSWRDWPLVRGDALATGVVRDQAPVAHARLPASPELIWKFTVPKGSFTSTPIVVDGKVYIGDADGTMRGIDLASGKELWKITGEDGYSASASYLDGRLYVGDVAGTFHCFSADGKKLWEVKGEAEIDSAANFFHGNVIYGSQDATLYCVTADKGAPVWQYKVQDQIRCSPTIVEDRAFVAGCDGKLHVIDLTKGSSLADVDIEAPTGSTPAVHGDDVFFGTEAGVFFSINWKTATVNWKWKDPKRTESIRSSAALVDGLAIFGSRDRHVRALEQSSGNVVWTFPTHGRIDSSPVAVGQRCYFGSSDGHIYGLNIKSGAKEWDYEAGGSFSGNPAVAAGRLLIASEDGVLYCFGAK